MLTMLSSNVSSNITYDESTYTLTIGGGIAFTTGDEVFGFPNGGSVILYDELATSFKNLGIILYDKQTDSLLFISFARLPINHNNRYYLLGYASSTTSKQTTWIQFNNYAYNFGLTRNDIYYKYNNIGIAIFYTASRHTGLNLKWSLNKLTFSIGVIINTNNNKTLSLSTAKDINFNDITQNYGIIYANFKNNTLFVSASINYLDNDIAPLGYFGNKNVVSRRFVYIYGYGLVYEGEDTNFLKSGIGHFNLISSKNIFAEYNETTDILSIHFNGGFQSFSNRSTNNGDLNISDLSQHSYSCLITFDPINKIYGYKLFEDYIIGMTTGVVGYFIDGRCEINGTKIIVHGYKAHNIRDNHIKYRICCFGDSITAGSGAEIPYHYFTTLYLNHYCRNFGIGGTGYINTRSVNDYRGTGQIGRGEILENNGNNTVLQYIQSNYDNIDQDIEAITIATGTNDIHNQMSVFETAIRNTYEWVLNNMTCPLIVCTPIRKQNAGPNSYGLYLKDYCDKIKEVCKEMNIPIIDMYEDVILHPDRENWRTKFITDGLHPTNVGHQRLATVFDTKLTEYLG